MAIINYLKSLVEKLIKRRQAALTFWPYCTLVSFLVAYSFTTLSLLCVCNGIGQVLIGLSVLPCNIGFAWFFFTLHYEQPPLPPVSTRTKKELTIWDLLVDVGIPIVSYCIKKYFHIHGLEAIFAFGGWYVCALSVKKLYQFEDQVAILEIFNTLVMAVIANTGLEVDLISLVFIIVNRLAEGKIKKWAELNESEETDTPAETTTQAETESSFTKKVKALSKKLVQLRPAFYKFWVLCSFVSFFLGYFAVWLMVLKVSNDIAQIMLGASVILFVVGTYWLRHIYTHPRPILPLDKSVTLSDVLVDMAVAIASHFIKRYFHIAGWEAAVAFGSLYIFAIGVKNIYQLEDEFAIIDIVNAMVSASLGANKADWADVLGVTFVAVNKVLMEKWIVDNDHEGN